MSTLSRRSVLAGSADPDSEALFVLDHGSEPVTVEVPGTHHALLTGTAVTDRVALGRYDVAVLLP
ncbi:Beta-galactosidase C-terminal domain [Streptomyces sp. NPDC056501]|uniref:Beta-galactosidase C-terminal domain n=1 Tax=Streptomyces sp. NPDC056501 TaxID=3345841 RepID=UPI0036AE4F7E